MIFKKKEFGGAALEYLIVTLFASAVSFGVIAFSGKLVKEKISKTLRTLGLEDSSEELDFLNMD